MFVFPLSAYRDSPSIISFPLPGPPVWSRVTPVAVRISIPSAIVPVIAAPDPVVSAVIATAIPLVTSTRNQHEAGRYNSVHDHSECVHKTLREKSALHHFIYSAPLYFRGRARDRYRSCRESPASIAWRPYLRSPIGRSGILGRDTAHARQRYNRPPGCGCRPVANDLPRRTIYSVNLCEELVLIQLKRRSAHQGDVVATTYAHRQRQTENHTGRGTIESIHNFP